MCPPGEQGPQGETGPQGEQGDVGEQGEQGETISLYLNMQTYTHIYTNAFNFNKFRI